MQVINSRYAPVQSLVKDHDPDRYFLSLFAPREHRPALWTLFALNYEIAKTREVVNETRLGLIRLQWWRDEIARLYDGGASDAHEILMALRQVIDKYGLPKELFDTLIYGREFDLEDVLPETLEGTMTYIEHTNMPLTDLVRSILTPPPSLPPTGGGMRSVSDGEAEPYTQLGGGATEVAINYGLIGLLRAVPFHAAQGRCYLPQDVLTDHGINPYALYKGKETEKLPPVIKILLDQFKNAEPKTRYLKAIQAHSNIYKKHIERHDYDVFKMAQSPPPAFKELRVSYKSFL